MNAANEVAVDSFIKGKIGFIKIPDLIEQTLDKSIFIKEPALDDLIESDKLARQLSEQLI
jgi:1-deoxy-D-xylulose-5-phosphate reductoisomerase